MHFWIWWLGELQQAEGQQPPRKISCPAIAIPTIAAVNTT